MNAAQIADLFNQCFKSSYGTVLDGGADEPLYEPGHPARIWYRADYVSSALHEAAHWLIAGPQRRRLEDYGYWYERARDASAQRRFEAAEARPQALEWILSISAGVEFRVSCDNFDQRSLDVDGFRATVQRETITWLQRGLPSRARKLQQALAAVSGEQLNCCQFGEPPGA